MDVFFFFLCPHTHAQKHHPPQIQNLILFDCVSLGTCGRAREAVSCSCLKGSMWRLRHINHKGRRKERERKDWGVRWVVERLYWQKLLSVCHCCCFTCWRHLWPSWHWITICPHNIRLGITNHITGAVLNKYMQMVAGMQIIPQIIFM